MSRFAKYKLEKRSVNNKLLFDEIHKFIDEGILSGEVIWSNDIHRISFVEIIEDVLSDFEFGDKIDQWNVICDLRNNTIDDMEKGKHILEVTYRQRNCLNTTRLIYTIQDLSVCNKDARGSECKGY